MFYWDLLRSFVACAVLTAGLAILGWGVIWALRKLRPHLKGDGQRATILRSCALLIAVPLVLCFLAWLSFLLMWHPKGWG